MFSGPLQNLNPSPPCLPGYLPSRRSWNLLWPANLTRRRKRCCTVTSPPFVTRCDCVCMFLLFFLSVSSCRTEPQCKFEFSIGRIRRCGAVRCGWVTCGGVGCGAVPCGAVRCSADFSFQDRTVRCGAMRNRGIGFVCDAVRSSV